MMLSGKPLTDWSTRYYVLLDRMQEKHSNTYETFLARNLNQNLSKCLNLTGVQGTEKPVKWHYEEAIN